MRAPAGCGSTYHCTDPNSHVGAWPSEHQPPARGPQAGPPPSRPKGQSRRGLQLFLRAGVCPTFDKQTSQRFSDELSQEPHSKTSSPRAGTGVNTAIFRPQQNGILKPNGPSGLGPEFQLLNSFYKCRCPRFGRITRRHTHHGIHRSFVCIHAPECRSPRLASRASRRQSFGGSPFLFGTRAAVKGVGDSKLKLQV